MNSISIQHPRIPRICLVNNPTFGNWDSCVFHQARGLFKSLYETTIQRNKDNSNFSKPSLVSSMDVSSLNNESLGTSGFRGSVCNWPRLRDLKTTTKSITNFFCCILPPKPKLYPSQSSLPHI